MEFPCIKYTVGIASAGMTTAPSGSHPVSSTTMPPIMQQIAPRTPNVSINHVQVTVTPFPPFPFLHSG